MSLLLALALSQAAYDAAVQCESYKAGTADLRGTVTEFPDSSVLSLHLTRSIETLDWKTSVFKTTDLGLQVARRSVQVKGGAFAWSPKLPAPGDYVLHVIFSPEMQTDPAVARQMPHEFTAKNFLHDLAVGSARDVLEQVERDVKAFDDAGRRIEALADDIEAAIADSETFPKKREKLQRSYDDFQGKFDAAAEAAILRANVDHVRALTRALMTLVLYPPGAEGGEIGAPIFTPSGEIITTKRGKELLKEMDPFLVREMALAAFRQIRLRAEACAALREQMKDKPSRQTIATRTRDMHEDLDQVARFLERVAAGGRAEAFEKLTKTKTLTLGDVRGAVAHLVDSTAGFLNDGKPAADDCAAEAAEVARKLDEIELKLRTGQDPPKKTNP